MSGIVKVLTGILGVMAVVACLATIGIIGYSFIGAGDDEELTAQSTEELLQSQQEVPTMVPEAASASDASETPSPIAVVSSDHVHDYEETVEVKATCYQSGRLKYICECGDFYYVDVLSTGHVADDWEVVREATAERDGLRVKKCIYCDEIIAQESIPYESETGTSDGSSSSETHVHRYTATTEREATCTLAGLRKYTCSCGNFYTEMIPAAGHVATDWTVVEEATTTQMGREQRTCSVCGVVLDSRPINVLEASATASASASATTASTASASASATPTATPHVHSYQSYVLKEANCTEKGIRSYVCSCGSSYAESIDLDLNNHTYTSVVIPATKTTQGYTVYTCIRCNYSYYDNYTPALSN